MKTTTGGSISDTSAGHHLEEELRSQPDIWAQALDAVDCSVLPDSGARVAIVGCGTSWFMAECYAALREPSGHGETDAFTASEVFPARDYDAVIALSRSGATTEVLDVVSGLGDGVRTIGLVADASTPLGGVVGDAIALPFADEQSVVQTRFATTAPAMTSSTCCRGAMLNAGTAACLARTVEIRSLVRARARIDLRCSRRSSAHRFLRNTGAVAHRIDDFIVARYQTTLRLTFGLAPHPSRCNRRSRLDPSRAARVCRSSRRSAHPWTSGRRSTAR